MMFFDKTFKKLERGEFVIVCFYCLFVCVLGGLLPLILLITAYYQCNLNIMVSGQFLYIGLIAFWWVEKIATYIGFSFSTKFIKCGVAQCTLYLPTNKIYNNVLVPILFLRKWLGFNLYHTQRYCYKEWNSKKISWHLIDFIQWYFKPMHA